MTKANDSIFNIIAVFLLIAAALSVLIFFIQQRDPAGFLAWVFGFAALLSGSGNGAPGVRDLAQR